MTTTRDSPARSPVYSGPTPPTTVAGRGILYRWLWRQQHATAAQGDSLLEAVMRARGLTDAAQIERFTTPRLTHLHDPSLIPDLDMAAARLLDAVKNAEPIVIYGDYDVDGVTATAVLYHALRALSPDPAHPVAITTYVPHRVDEGYGLNVAAIESLAAAGCTVMVTVDCGVTAVDAAQRARALGIDLIITDHHNPPAQLADLPPAFAVVHPRRPDSAYPFGELSGAGVAFKLAWRLATLHSGGHKVGPKLQALLLDLLPFAALGAIADVVPLVDENRVIAWAGLGRARATPFTGLRALIDAAGLAGERVKAWDVGFKLAPRLNASGRMAHAAAAVELFTSADGARAEEIARGLEQHNAERRKVEKAITDEASAMAEARGMTRDDRRAIVLAHPAWHAGVVGIACSRLVERFGRPTILMSLKDGEAHGSCRSIAGFNIAGALAACARHLRRHGGHDMAAGLALDAANLPAFTDDFTAHANERISVEQLTPSITIDAATTLDALTPAAVSELGRLEPHGAGNPGLRLLIEDAQVAGQVRPMGASGDHLSFSVRSPGGGGVSLTRIVAWGWGAGGRRERIVTGGKVRLVVTPAVSTFTGKPAVEPVLVDMTDAQ